MRKLAIKSLVNAAAFYLSSYAPAWVAIDRPESALVAGVILALLWFTLRPILMLVALPLNIITLGLFIVIINTLTVMLAGALTPGLHFAGIGAAFLTALIVTAFDYIFCQRCFSGR